MKKKIKIIIFSAITILLVVIAVLLYPLTYKGTDEIILMNDSEYESLQEIINQDQFKGKTIFVDIWGTTCAPCIREFDHAKELKEKYKGKPVEFLYLGSIDRIDEQVRWKQIIQDKELKGYHVPINIKLYGKI